MQRGGFTVYIIADMEGLAAASERDRDAPRGARQHAEPSVSARNSRRR